MYYRISVLLFMLHVPQRCRSVFHSAAYHIYTDIRIYTYLHIKLVYIGIKNSGRVLAAFQGIFCFGQSSGRTFWLEAKVNLLHASSHMAWPVGFA